MVYNKYQSTPEQLNLDNYPEEIKEQFFDFINTVPYIKNLISENRPYAKDCPRDQDGKIIIDFTNPPIIEDTDYFRPTAIHFQKYGCVTKLRPNRNPNSEYGKWIREETRRCFYGYVRESDGAWITGDMYFFLNYCPIMKVKRLKGKKGIRVVDFPDFLEGQWLRFMYIQHARDNAKHGSELASRGKGKAHPYDEVVYTSDGLKNWEQVKIGDYLFGDDGNLTKVIDIPFDDVAPIYEVELSSGHKIKCSEGHLWKVQSHCRGEIIISTKELLDLYKRPRKIGPHNPKGYELDCTIPKGEGAEFPYQATKVDPYTFGLLLGDGCFRNPGYRNTVNLTAVNSDFEVYKNYIPYSYHKVLSGKYLYSLEIQDIYSILEEYDLNQKKSEDKFIPEEYKYNSKEVRIALLKGLLDADGTVSKGKIELTLSSKQMIEDVRWICASLGIPCSNLRIKKSWYYDKDSKRKHELDAYRLSIFSSINLFNLPRKTEAWESRSQTAYVQSKYKGYKITNITYCGEQKAKCVTVDNKSHCYLIGEFIPTHNSFSMASIAAKRFLLGELDETTGEPTKGVETFISSYFKTYLNDDGVLNKFEKYIDFCAEYTQFPKKRLTSSLDKMKWTSGYKESNSEIKKGSGNEVIGISVKDSPGKLRGKRGAFIGLEEMGSFPNLIELYSTLRPSMEDGDIVFGMIYAQGTAGDKDSDFSAAQKIMYSPRAFNMQPIKNVYDKVGQGKPEFVYFYPAYVNRNGCYNKDGISDVTKAILEVLINRYNVKYNTTDSTLITKTIAEHPIVPQEAVLRTRGNLFPSSQINERLNQIDTNPNIFDDVYVGELIFDKAGQVKYVPSDDVPIRVYPTEDNKDKGAIEFYEMPQKNREGKVFPNRYIIGHDPVDDDVSQTMSLTSTFVFDLLTDRIVAEYTGRQEYADDNFEIVRKLCLFYNAKCMYEQNKKGIYSYFKRKGCLTLLAETPEYLKEQNIIKEIGYGNKGVGVNATANVNGFADRLTKEWLIKKQVVLVKEDGQEKEVEIPNLFTVKNRAFLQEAAAYNPTANFDRIRAFGMVMIYREAFLILYQGDTNKAVEEDVDANAPENDEFFQENFDGRFQ